MATAAACG